MPNPHKQIINNQEFWMLPIAGGPFLMGSPEGDGTAHGDEKPQHRVTVPDFLLGKFPVTQALWRDVVSADSEDFTQNNPDISLNPAPSRFDGDDLPVESVSWDDAQTFIQKLNILTQSSRPAGYYYRLPTEAEWEYAARGGISHTEGYQYAGGDRLKDLGWFNENSGGTTKPVGQKCPNQCGIHDLSGNVFEWCEDDWHDKYDSPPDDGSAWIDGSDRGSKRVYRGGSWLYPALPCLAAYRYRPPAATAVVSRRVRGAITISGEAAYHGISGSRGNRGFRLVLALQSVG